jgi:hypothetical protein
LITKRVVQDGDAVFGVYDSDSTYVLIHYINKRPNQGVEAVKSHLDVKGLFAVMEALDVRKGRK